jgi:hypothetical protein
MGNHMLIGEQERELLDSININSEDSWLMLLYSTMCKKVWYPLTATAVITFLPLPGL